MIKTKKQMFLIIASFVLVILLGTTTYAFFNYTRTGVSNVVKVGRIYFNTEQTTINLSNVFPIDRTNINNDTDNVGVATIHITGDTTYSGGIEYLVSAVDVHNTIGEGYGAKKIPISISVDYTASENKTIGSRDDDYYTNRGGDTSLYKVIGKNITVEDNKLLVGYIKPGENGIDGEITIKAFIDNDKIAISDTYPSGTHSEIVGEEVYEPNPNMNSDELKYCVTMESYYETYYSYTLNPNMTQEELSACATYIENEWEGKDSLNGTTGEDFCRGNATGWGNDFYDFLDWGEFYKKDIIFFFENNIIDFAEREAYENYCLGNGEISNRSFQEKLANNYYNSSRINDYFSHNVIRLANGAYVNEWTDGTSNKWANGRTVLTTEEWNSLQSDGISFKVKVEANEGIWVPVYGNAMNQLPIATTNSNINNVKKIQFINMSSSEMHTRYNAAEYKYDLTYNGEGEVLGWLEKNDEDNTKNTLYIASDGPTFLTTCQNLFENYYYLETVDFTNADTSRVTSMKDMFYRANSIKEIDLSNLNTENVTDMSYLVARSSSIKKVNLSGLNLSKVQHMSYMFDSCINLEEINFEGSTVKDLRSVSSMFNGVKKVEHLDLSNFGGDNLENLDSFGIASMESLKTLTMRNFNFGHALFGNAFKGLDNVETIDFTGANFSNIQNVPLFSGSSKLTTIIVSEGTDFSSFTNYDADRMFNGCTSLVGGAGTTYDANHIDSSYAHVDGGTNNPGYFTVGQ